ncbi:MAG: tyrosine--tRNA ligase [bacterium]|nr:tyrosine--tRNA ligase [bacterium]
MERIKRVITHPQIREFLDDRKIDKIYPSMESLRGVLESGKKLTIYHGVDPTGPQLHIGHSTNFFLLRKLQNMGHKIILLIGDFTAMVGDPTGKTTTRKPLTRKEVLVNAKDYKNQLAKILDFNSKKNPIEVKFNSFWLDKLTFKELAELSANFTIQQMITRDMFQERIKDNKPVSLQEFLYPIMQGYDSVAMNVDMEVGGTDQTFNMLIGRDLIKIYKNKEKFVLTTRLLINPKTNKKIMNKSEGSFVALNDSSKEMYGKIMSLPDEVILTCFELCTNLSSEEIQNIESRIKAGENPRNIKARLATEIVGIYYDKKTAEKAEEEFNRIFKEGSQPTDIPEIKISDKKILVCDLLVKAKLALSKSEAKRLVEQGAIDIDETVLSDWRKEITPKKGMIIRAGKRKFVKLI